MRCPNTGCGNQAVVGLAEIYPCEPCSEKVTPREATTGPLMFETPPKGPASAAWADLKGFDGSVILEMGGKGVLASIDVDGGFLDVYHAADHDEVHMRFLWTEFSSRVAEGFLKNARLLASRLHNPENTWEEALDFLYRLSVPPMSSREIAQRFQSAAFSSYP